MKIVLVTETLNTGGAETFVVRLANSLCLNHEVSVVNFHLDLSKPEVVEQIHPNVNLFNINIPFKRIVIKIDGLLRVFNINLSILSFLNIYYLGKVLKLVCPEVVHSHLFNCDYYVASVKQKVEFKFNHVSTNHGDYLIFHSNGFKNDKYYINKRNFTLKKLNHLVNISDEQLVWCQELVSRNVLHAKIHKVLNGYINSYSESLKRSDLNIPDNAFVYGMVARGIKEKGWSELLSAFIMNSLPNSYLLLIGEGSELDYLKSKFSLCSNIIFVGFCSNPVVYINLFDVGILPSYYKAESLPTVIIEYLFCGKPVIASDIGEIKKMISGESGNKIAGELIINNHCPVDVVILANKMKEFSSNIELLNSYKNITRDAFVKFNMQTCVDNYIRIYNS